MKLYFSGTSPFVRKVMLSAHERGIADQIECLSESEVGTSTPLAKVPSLVTDDGDVVIDSLVICDYFESLGSGPALIPTDRVERNEVLRLHALGDGIMEAAVASVTEGRRPADKQWQGFHDSQHAKINGALAAIESQANTFADRVNLGTLTVGAALGYLDLRFADWGWRRTCPSLRAWYERFSQRPSMRATEPPT